MKVRTISALACGTILLAALGLTLAAVREPILIEGQVDLTSFTGEAIVTIAGEELHCTVGVDPAGGMHPNPGGGYDFPVVIHQFAMEDSTLTTAGPEFSEPTDENPAVHTLHGYMEIVDGSGVFECASGELRVNGQMDWSIGQATFAARGVISR